MRSPPIRQLLSFLTLCSLATLESPVRACRTAANTPGGVENLVAVTVDWKQAANDDSSACDDDPGGSDLGDVHWVAAILNTNTCEYLEGMAVPQRLILTNINPTAGDVHVLDFRVQSSKANLHAYDFLVSWQQALDTANFVAPGQNLMQQLFVNRCLCEILLPGTAACNALHTSGNTAFASLPVPGLVAGPNCATSPDVVASRVAAFEALFPSGRTAQLFGNSPFSGTPTCSFLGYDQSCGDTYALYSMTWTSASTSIAIECAAHLAIGGGSGFPNNLGYEVGYGSSNPVPALYHFKIDQLDGLSLGNQDNQIVSTAIGRATSFSSFCSPGVGGVIACPCSNPPSGPGRGCNNSSGTGGAILSATGGAYLSADNLVFTTSGERPTSLSIVTQWTGANATGVVFGQGVRCTSGTFKRLYTKNAVGGSITAPNFGAGDPTVSARSAALGSTILAGQSRWYLVYYRDPSVLGGCPASSTSNSTQTGEVTWSP